MNTGVGSIIRPLTQSSKRKCGLKSLVDVEFDPAAWISTTSTIVGGGMDLTMADVDDYLVGSG
jgi:hypothetical protein